MVEIQKPTYQHVQALGMTPETFGALPEGNAFTCLIDGVPVGMAGVTPVSSGRYQAWSLLADHAGPHMLTITRYVRSFLNCLNVRRVEMLVRHDYEKGHKWALALGFVNETPDGMNGYGVNGETYSLYARVI